MNLYLLYDSCNFACIHVQVSLQNFSKDIQKDKEHITLKPTSLKIIEKNKEKLHIFSVDFNNWHFITKMKTFGQLLKVFLEIQLTIDIS